MEENDNKNIIEDAAVNVGNKAKNGIINKTTKAAKFAVKKILATIAHLIMNIIITLLPYIAVVTVVICVIAGICLFLELITGEDSTSLTYEALGIASTDADKNGDIANAVQIVQDSKGYHLEFKADLDAKLEEVIKKLNEQNTSLKMENKESLKKYIIAEALTKYLYLGGESDGVTKFQGTIRIKRISPQRMIGSVGDYKNAYVRDLTYVDLNSFRTLLNNKDSSVLEKFSLDENKDVVTATWTVNNGNTELKEINEHLNYKETLSKYTMPFEYPLFFLIDGECEEFSVELAELAMKSKLEIAVVDNVTVTKTTQSEYEKQTKVEKTIIKDSNGVEQGSVTSPTISVNDGTQAVNSTVNTIENVESKVLILNIDSWAIKKQNQVQLKYTENLGNEEKTTSEPTTSVDNSSDNKIATITTTKSVGTKTDSYTYEFTITDNEVEDNTDGFVNLIKKYEDKLRNNLLPEWLFGLMEDNNKTKDMVDLTKYLLYKSTDKNYGVTNFNDIDLFKMEDMNEVENNINNNYYSNGGDIVEVGTEMMKYLIENKYLYYQGNWVPLEYDYEQTKTKTVDCSSYVCWVLYRCGYTNMHFGSDDKGWQLDTGYLPQYLEKSGFKKITSMSDLQAGDIVFYEGHVQIYVGKNNNGDKLFLSAGRTPYEQSTVSNPYITDNSNMYYAYREVKKKNTASEQIKNNGEYGYSKTFSSSYGLTYKLYQQCNYGYVPYTGKYVRI